MRKSDPEPVRDDDVYDPMIPGDDVAGGDPGLADRLEQSLLSLRPERGPATPPPTAPYQLDLRHWDDR